MPLPSLTTLYRIGTGPSSSHTMGPREAARQFREGLPAGNEAHPIAVILFGSLAATGVGHRTDMAIREALAPHPVELELRPGESLPGHPNGMRFTLRDEQGETLAAWEGYSPGGGRVCTREGLLASDPSCYPFANLAEIMAASGGDFWGVIAEHEPNLHPFLAEVWRVMEAAIDRGLKASGELPGGLRLRRRAQEVREKCRRHGALEQRTGTLAAYALAVAEENAAGGMVVAAPTCGSSGILPGVLHFLARRLEFESEAIHQALGVAGLFGLVVRQNASISGAEVGCQGEVGTACAMAAAAAATLLGGSREQIEYAAEMGLEHHLGLTCDPIAGLVQIPCIERNAMAALRALDCAEYAILTDGAHRVRFDQVVAAMNATGRDLPSLYRETSSGGLARFAAES